MRLDTVTGVPPVLTAFKKAEDSGNVVARFYEPYGGQARVVLSTAFELASATRTNILEEAQGGLEVVDDALELTLSPFKIATVMLEPK